MSMSSGSDDSGDHEDALYKANKLELEQTEWYWGDVTREATVEIFEGSRDGSFLVRDASTHNGQFTLTVLYNQKLKLLRIFFREGKFGFRELIKFSSITELIHHFSERPFTEYNANLCTKLLYPVSKIRYGNDLMEALEAACSKYWDQERCLELLSKLHDKNEDAIYKLRRNVRAFDACILVYRDQITCHEQFQQNMEQEGDDDDAASRIVDERVNLEENLSHIKSRLKELESKREGRLDNIKIKLKYSQLVDPEIRKTKFSLYQLKIKRENLTRKLQNANVKVVDSPLEGSLRVDDIWNTNLWYDKGTSREDAVRILRGSSAGTFLVRSSSDGHFALSICIHGGKVQHCKIYQFNSGFGFSHDRSYFPSLSALVLHYYMNSLVENNPLLQTCLLYPGLPVAPDPQGKNE